MNNSNSSLAKLSRDLKKLADAVTGNIQLFMWFYWAVRLVHESPNHALMRAANQHSAASSCANDWARPHALNADWLIAHARARDKMQCVSVRVVKYRNRLQASFVTVCLQLGSQSFEIFPEISV